MEAKITNKIIIAYSLCPRKGVFAITGEASASKCDYCTIVNAKRSMNREKYLGSKDFLAQYGGEPGQIFRSEKCIADCDTTYFSTKLSATIPLIFSGTQQILTENKIELAFIGFVYSKIFKVAPKYGIIIPLSGKAVRINLTRYYKKIKDIVEKLLTYENSNSQFPPGLRNRHCPCCEYRAQCEKINRDSGSISALSSITPMLYKKLAAKGITTIEQLSYQYRPRRRKKKKKPRAKIAFQPALQALAIKENKVFVQILPEALQITSCIILDFEGHPDENTYYLIGIIHFQNSEKRSFSFWANSTEEEQHIWKQFLIEIRRNPGLPIYHYGSYDQVAVKCLAERYGDNPDDILPRMVNVNSFVYGKIYFPTYSNSLKELAGFLGVKWSSSEATGLQSIVWRQNWISTGDETYKEALLKYNMEDCHALVSLIQFLSNVTSQDIQQQIDFLDRPLMQSTTTGTRIHELFSNILKSAHSDFSKKKISLRKKNDGQAIPESSQFISRKVYNPKPNKIIQVHPRRKCPRCGYTKPKISNRSASLKISDLIFSKQGCKRLITLYKGFKIYCCKCKHSYNPKVIADFGRGTRFGTGFMAWAIHERIVYRLPFHTIVESAEELFNISVGDATLEPFMENFAKKHRVTEKRLLQALLKSPFIHADETQISIKGSNWYVWVFTDGKHVIFKLTETRESDIVHTLLEGYKGVLITDFYGGYDSVNCKQQKCLSHLIRDVNDNLWKEPFNIELEIFAVELQELFEPIFNDLSKYGSKTRHLLKHIRRVDRFFDKNIDSRDYKTETVLRFQKRFRRYRDSIFMFLSKDNIAWNNNTAERAIRHLAVQRKISGSFGERTMPTYLLLLGIAQSCRFQKKSFLKFLLSEKRSVDDYQERKQRFRILKIRKNKNSSL